MIRVIGILALQGGFREHQESFERLSVETTLVRTPKDLEKCSALIIPGGESTTFETIASKDLWRSIRLRIENDQSFVVWGTCAGSIVLSSLIHDTASCGDEHLVRQGPIGVLNCSIIRNYFGRQSGSFVGTGNLIISRSEDDVIMTHKFPMVFIRAPVFHAVHCDSVKVMATVERDGQEHIVGVIQDGRILATTFHPELTSDLRIHQHVLDIVASVHSQ